MESINLTNTLAGLAAIQRAMAGEDILFTKLEIGDGVLTNTDVSGMTGLINKTKDYVLGAVQAEDSEIVRLRSNISNGGVTQDLIIREYGIYAKFGNEQEFLFAYLNVGDLTTPLPNQTIGRYELNRDFILYIGNSLHVDFTSNGHLIYVSVNQYKSDMNKKANVENTIEDLKNSNYKNGDIVKLLGYYKKGDGSSHLREITDNPTKPFVTLKNGLKAQLTKKSIRPEWVGETNIYNVIENHIKPLQDNKNYTIKLYKREYECIGYGFIGGVRKMNVVKYLSIVGSGMGEISLPNKEKIIGGTIIHGPVTNSADGFSIKDVGIDLGKEWVDANNYIGWIGDKGDEGLVLNEALDRVNHPKLITGCKAENIIVNMYDNTSRYHAFLNEASDGNYVNNIELHGGIHGLVVKCSNITITNAKVYGGGANAVIIKSDLRDIDNIVLNNVQVFPYKVPYDTVCGLRFNPNGDFNITNVRFENCRFKHLEYPIHGNAGGMVTAVTFNNTVFENCQKGSDLSEMYNGLIWTLTDVSWINCGTLYLPKSGGKYINNLYIHQLGGLEHQKAETVFMIYHQTYLNGCTIIARSDDYTSSMKIDSLASAYTIDNVQHLTIPLDLNKNPYFIEKENIYGLFINKFLHYTVNSAFSSTFDNNSYLYERYTNNKLEIEFCLRKIANSAGNIILDKNPLSPARTVVNQRFAGGLFQGAGYLPLVATDTGLGWELTTVPDNTYVYGCITINLNKVRDAVVLI